MSTVATGLRPRPRRASGPVRHPAPRRLPARASLRPPGRGATGPAVVHRSLGRRRTGRLLAATGATGATTPTTPAAPKAGAGPLGAAPPEVRRRLLAAIDHELRTPLTNVVGFVEMLLDGEAGRLTEDQALMLQRIAANADQLLVMVRALLDGCSTGLRRGVVVDLAEAVVAALGGVDALSARLEDTGP